MFLKCVLNCVFENLYAFYSVKYRVDFLIDLHFYFSQWESELLHMLPCSETVFKFSPATSDKPVPAYKGLVYV